jgi:cell division protein FtsX
MKKTIFITVLLTIVLIAIAFISVKFYSYAKLKNDCIKNITKGYSFSLYFKSDTMQSEIEKFIMKTKQIPGVKNIETKSKDEALKEFMDMGNNNPSIQQALDELGGNPLSSSITVNSNISDINSFLNLEESILNQARNSGLDVISHNDRMVHSFQKEIEKVQKASFLNDFSKFIFSGEGNYFFSKNYGIICNPNFLR